MTRIGMRTGAVLIALATHAALGATGVSAQDKPIGILLAAGDIATCSSDPTRSGKATAALVKREVARAKAENPDVEVRVLALGDLAYPSGSSGSIKCFAATWGQFFDIMLPVPGNHDYQTNKAAAYFAYFKSTLKDLEADKKLGTYALDFPSAGEPRWRLIALNSNDATGAAQDQVKWLKAELQQAQGKKCVLAFAHAFYYSSGLHGHDDGHGQPQNVSVDLAKPLLPGKHMRAIFRALYAHRASVFLAGHDHHFEQLGRANADARPADRGKSAITQDGVRSFVVGTGGKLLYASDYKNKWAFTEAYDVDDYGILKIELYPASYKWEFLTTTRSPSLKVIKNVDSDDCNLAK